MMAVPTRSPATTIITRDLRRPMFRAARRARSGRSPTTRATKARPRRTATADHSGRATALRPPRLFDDLPVPHPQEEVHDLRRRLRVEVPRWFVGPDDRGVVHERAGDRDPLLLPRAELRGLVVRPASEFDGLEDGERLPPRVPRGHLRHEERQFDVLDGGQDREQVVRLEDEPHPTGAVAALLV